VSKGFTGAYVEGSALQVEKPKALSIDHGINHLKKATVKAFWMNAFPLNGFRKKPLTDKGSRDDSHQYTGQ